MTRWRAVRCATAGWLVACLVAGIGLGTTRGAMAAPPHVQATGEAPDSQSGAHVSRATTSTAQAARPSLPARLPDGYVMEARGEVRWIYPTSAEDDVAELQAQKRRIWRRLERALGQQLAPELDIRVAINPEDMRRLVDGRALPSYSTGVAFPREGLILLSLSAPETFLRPDMSQLLTHELAHVALQRAIGKASVPRWFTEGVAIHEADERTLTRIRTLWQGTIAKQLLSVEQLSGAFPADHHEVALAYAQSADLVRYMLEGDHGGKRFRDLIEALRNGQSFADAVHSAYHVTLSYLEREWRTELSQRYGRWPTVLTGLTGAWVLAALLLVAGYVRTRRKHHRTLARWKVEEAAEDARRATQQLAVRAQTATEGGQTHRVDEVFDRLDARRRNRSSVPTIQHEGRSYTLH